MLGNPLLRPSDGPYLNAVLPELAHYGLGQPRSPWGVAVDADRVRSHLYVVAVYGPDPALRHASEGPLGELLGVELLGDAAGKDDLAFVVVLAVGEELPRDGLAHLLGYLVGLRGLHAV